MSSAYVSLAEAARRFNVSEFTLRARLRAGELPAYANPLDRRRILIPVADLEKYATPRPVPARRGQEEAAVPA